MSTDTKEEITCCDTADSCDKIGVVQLALDIGENMLLCGGEVDRVEDTVERICKAYGAERADVFSITTVIIVTATWPGNEIVTQSRCVQSVSRDFHKLAAINDLSRRMCREKMDIEIARQNVEDIIKGTKGDARRMLLGSLLASGGFVIFFGGTLRDCVAAMIAAVAIFVIDRYVYNNKVNKVLYYMISSFVAGLISIATVYMGIGQNIDMIMIGCIMLVIPGINFTAAVEDILVGDTATGALKFCESVLLACSIAGGFGLSVYLCGGLNLI